MQIANNSNEADCKHKLQQAARVHDDFVNSE